MFKEDVLGRMCGMETFTEIMCGMETYTVKLHMQLQANQFAQEQFVKKCSTQCIVFSTTTTKGVTGMVEKFTSSLVGLCELDWLRRLVSDHMDPGSIPL